MKLAGIVAEYNPFHKGHEYHIEETKKITGCDGVVAVMSGNFVQRGEGAIFDKEKRAQAAVLCGADVVLELGAKYAVQTAEVFAENAIHILSSIPEVKYLSFGAECSDINLISDAAKYILEEKSEYKEELKRLLKTGVSYPRARQEAINHAGFSEIAEIMSSPNNILGIEYVKAILKNNYKIEPYLVKRKGAEHDSDEGADGIFSASKIRGLIQTKDKEKFLAIPKAAADLFENAPIFDYKSFEKGVLANILMMSRDELKKIAGATEGLENRIKDAAEKAKSLEEFLDAVKTKRYAYSSLRRIAISSYLKIMEEEKYKRPSYIKVLDFSEKGQEILNTIKKTAKIPVIKNMKALKKEEFKDAAKDYETECRIDRLYKLYQKSGGRV